MVLCPDVASCMDSRFDCRDLLQRSVIHYEAERKASSAIIKASSAIISVVLLPRLHLAFRRRCCMDMMISLQETRCWSSS